MQDYQFIGMLVLGLTAIISLFVAIYKPLSNIEKRLTTMEIELKNMNKTLEGQGGTLQDHEKRITQNTTDIKLIKKTKKRNY